MSESVEFPQMRSAAVAALSEGLTSREAAERLQREGPNTVAEESPRRLQTFLSKFWGPVPAMLEVAIVLELVLGHWTEAIIIAALLLFNAVLGFSQETRAQRALALLHQRLTVRARVRRDGRWQVLSAVNLVPGDLVHVRVGDVVPADLRLAEGHILVDQSALTGESLPVDQGAGGLAYAGALIRRGEASRVVTATGPRTYFGTTAELVRTAQAPSHLERLVLALVRYLVVLDLLLAVAVFGVAVVRGTPLSAILPFAVMLLVASVPVALPAAFTLAASLGSLALAQAGVLVTRLSAIEDAATMDVLCIDKTGTITENRLNVEALHAFAPADEDELLRLAALASDEATQDPIDTAILEAARQRDLLVSLAQRLRVVPFDPSTKCSEALIRDGDQVLRVVKGAPATIAELTQTPWSELEAEVTAMSARGYRVLAVAAGADAALRLVGCIALGDPPRPDSAPLLAGLQARGLRVLLVTGDGAATAQAVAAEVGLTGPVAPAGLLHDGVDPASLAPFAIFAGVFPQEKFFLVRALQQAGHVVGMTGDGVNDAPALRQADVGIAVANATDVAKAAASLVLTRAGLGAILAAVENSRRIFQRMMTYVMNMSMRKLSIPLFLGLGVLLFGLFVLSPRLVILLIFANDVMGMAVSTDRATPSSHPDRWIIRPLLASAASLAVLVLALSALVFWVGSSALRLGLAETQTLAFVWLVFSSQATIYLTRVRRHFWTFRPGRWVLVGTLLDAGVVTLLATLGWLMAPVPPAFVGGLLVLSLIYLATADWLKVRLTTAHARPPSRRSFQTLEGRSQGTAP